MSLFVRLVSRDEDIAIRQQLDHDHCKLYFEYGIQYHIILYRITHDRG